MEIVEIINKLVWTIDTLGGGMYIPCGIAMQVGTMDSRPDLPFLTKSGKYAIIMELVDIYAKILGKQAAVLCKYCPRDKKEIMNTMWTTIEEMQELDTNADVSQFVRMLQE